MPTISDQTDLFRKKLLGKTGKISDKTLEMHLGIYAVQVRRAKELLAAVEKEDLPEEGALPGSLFRANRLDLSYCLCAARSHELYFQILGGSGAAPQGKLREWIDRDFGSLGRFLRDLRATALASDSWAWSCLDPASGRLFNLLGDPRGGLPLWGGLPLIALDMEDHAFLLDFGQDRAAYLDSLLGQIDWEAVASRLPLL
ncbi:Superoxide dismutase [Mn/Fe] [Methylacidimicrobium cyclopophantes]|uniref:Superoxide dismutase [Mn/Fe] n=1 Tax=Methylacidimicrobium cyclopophantes TaxID=1041766 RepID=A0A5E6MQS5_9BACT|nr:Superoxide dismutase [Mn/Fe] [Methylacidimicrobium cyclopophantes]